MFTLAVVAYLAHLTKQVTGRRVCLKRVQPWQRCTNGKSDEQQHCGAPGVAPPPSTPPPLACHFRQLFLAVLPPACPHQATIQRYNVFNLFLAIPTGFLRALANKKVGAGPPAVQPLPTPASPAGQRAGTRAAGVWSVLYLVTCVCGDGNAALAPAWSNSTDEPVLNV